MENQYLTISKIIEYLGVQIIYNKYKNKLLKETMEILMFRYFNIRNFEIPKYRFQFVEFLIWIKSINGLKFYEIVKFRAKNFTNK